MPLILQPNFYFYRKIRQDDAIFASFPHIFLRDEEKENGVLISTCNDLAIFQKYIY